MRRRSLAVFTHRSKSSAVGHSIIAVNAVGRGNGARARSGPAPPAPAGPARPRRRVRVLRDRDFAHFFAGYATSLLGTSMSALAVSFAVLDSGGTASDLGVVLAAGIVPQVLFMLGGGVLADRLGRRPVMLGADAARCAAQAALAGAVLAGQPALWVFILLAMARGTGDAVFTPALSGLTVELAPPDDLVNANALLSAARSAAVVAGPSLAGILVALAGPGTVIALDAGSYAVSVLALASLRLPAAAIRAGHSCLEDLRDGWAEFRGRAWLVITDGPVHPVQPADLGAVPAARPGAEPGLPRRGGGLGRDHGLLRRRVRAGGRCWPWAAARTVRWSPPPWRRSATALPCALLALRAPVAAVAAGALVGRGRIGPGRHLRGGCGTAAAARRRAGPGHRLPGGRPRSRSARSRSPPPARSRPCSGPGPCSGSGPPGPR